MFVGLKTDGDLRLRADRLALRLGLVAVPVAGGFLVWTAARPRQGLDAAERRAGRRRARRCRRCSSAVAARAGRSPLTAVTIVATTVTLFGSLYPDVLPSTTDPAGTLTTTNAASTPYTLAIMTWVALAVTPIVLAYQAWTYWVFRRRLTRDDIPAATGLPPRKPVVRR